MELIEELKQIPGLPGAIFTGLTSLFGGSAANRARQAESQQMMAFQERMSSTAYQRAMQDMREAGLNPMLAAKVGPASSPIGAMANIQDIGTPAAQTATSAYQAETQRQSQEQQGDLIEAQVVKVAAETEVSKERAREIGEHINLMMQQRMTEQEKGNLIRNQILKLEQEVGYQTALRFLKELEADAYANADKNIINPYSARLISEFVNDGTKVLGNIIGPAVIGRAIRSSRRPYSGGFAKGKANETKK